MTLPEGRKPLTDDDLADLAGHPSTWRAEIEMLKDQLAKAEARQPVVKALVWEEEDGNPSCIDAIGCGILYRVLIRSHGQAVVRINGSRNCETRYESPEAAKDACQAHYERRILSAIEWKESKDDT